MKTQYTLLSGETLDFPTPPERLATFLHRVIDATKDADITEEAMADLVHGPENPLFDLDLVPGAAVATAKVYRNPIFHVMLDCIARKRLGSETGAFPARARFAMTVPDAAIQLGITESAVRQAIYTNRLRARKDGGTYYIDSRSVAGYRVSHRGPPRRPRAQAEPGGVLQARIGSGPDASFRVKHSSEELAVEEQGASEWISTIPAGWHRIAVLGTGKEICRYWEIEPSEGESVLQFEGFYLRGGFRIIEAISSSPKARSAFRLFEPR
ncbi:MAG: helix-turn-helix domain-containing protein [Polyangiaceae bacterium]|nr:helix-turn-helix domain-containing protein [Polyangiaceae bacterium]